MNQDRNCLIIRLSSLGDVILASAALQSQALPEKVDWLVAAEYSDLLKNHPKIRKLHIFHRSKGFIGWVELCRDLWTHHYDEIYDLHGSLRTRWMRVLFLFWGLKVRLSMRSPRKSPQWFKIDKQKLRLWGFFVLKRFWPRVFMPEAWVSRFSRRVGGTGTERPDLRHLCQEVVERKALFPVQKGVNWICVMPSSRWSGKKWPVSFYADLIGQMKIFPVVLGSSKDQEGLELCRELEKRSVSFLSAVGLWDLPMTAWALSQCPGGYLGGDTGLAHLAEAVGVPARIIFGPTHPEMGFGPWRSESRSIQLSLACSPCSRNGRFCYRLGQPYHCLRGLSAQEVYLQMAGGRE
jgi:ADP-heptose:LPS heptosyltransferase